MKEWYPEEGHRVRPEEDWKLIMGCTKSGTCERCERILFGVAQERQFKKAQQPSKRVEQEIEEQEA